MDIEIDRNKLSRGIKTARDLVAAGWVKGWFVQVTEAGRSYCAFGALNSAFRGEDEYIHAACRAMRNVIGVENVTTFNDDPETTKDMVLRMFDATLAKNPMTLDLRY